MIVKDERLGNYEVHHDGSNYTVVEKTGKLDKEGKEVFKTHSYCSSMFSAINKIIKLKVEGEEDTYDLRGYADSINQETKKLESLLA